MRGAAAVGVDVNACAARDRTPDAGGDGHRVSTDRGERGGRPAAGCERSTSRSRSTARASGATRIAGSRRRARLAPSRGRLVFLGERPARRCSVLPRRRGTIGETTAAAAAWDAPDRWPRATAAVEFHLGHGELLRRSSGERVRGRAARRAPALRRARKRTSTTTIVTADWARKWPAEEIWAARKPA